LGTPRGILKINTKPSSLGLKWDGFDANVLPQDLKYYRGHFRVLSYRGGEENDPEMPLKLIFNFGHPLRQFIRILFNLGTQIFSGQSLTTLRFIANELYWD
jgi:hypothetical protein